MEYINNITNYVRNLTPTQYGMGALGLMGIYLAKQYFNGGTVSSDLLKDTKQLNGKVIIVTGASPGGIGYETSRVLHGLGGTIILAVRSEMAGKEARELISKQNGHADRLVVMLMDLTDLESVKKFAQEFKSKFNRLDMLINNAGVMVCPHATTKQGIEIQFGTNHIGHFLLTQLLLDMVKKTNGKIINLSSRAASSSVDFVHKYATYEMDTLKGDCKSILSTHSLYKRSKLANVLFTKKLSRELAMDTTTTAQSYSVHPGAVQTNLGRHIGKAITLLLMSLLYPLLWLLLKSAHQGAQTTLHVALSDKSKLKPGSYYSDCHENVANPCEDSIELQDCLWKNSFELCKEYLN